MEQLKLEFPTLARKQDAINYINEFKEYHSQIHGAGGLNKYLDKYENWIDTIEKDLKLLPNKERVPAETYFLVRENDNQIVGMIQIRLCLNKNLRKLGGHIGYGIRPTERRKGYNKINLYLALEICQKHGIKKAWLDCDKDNLASAKTMQALGGKLVKEFYSDEKRCIIQKYIINVNKSLEKYKNIYKI